MKSNNFLIISSCSETWGGSEELWYNLSKLLIDKNHNVSFYKDIIDYNHTKIKSLENNGVATYSILRGQNVIAPSLSSTDGEFVKVAVDVDTIYFIVKRTVNSNTVYYIETFIRI